MKNKGVGLRRGWDKRKKKDGYELLPQRKIPIMLSSKKESPSRLLLISCVNNVSVIRPNGYFYHLETLELKTPKSAYDKGLSVALSHWRRMVINGVVLRVSPLQAGRDARLHNLGYWKRLNTAWRTVFPPVKRSSHAGLTAPL